MTLGEKLRELRLKKGMTLQDVAEKTGYSKALISRIENDAVSPSIGSLVKISATLHVRLHTLFAAVGGGAPSLVKKGSGGMLMVCGDKIRVESLGGVFESPKMDAVVETFEPGADRERPVIAAEEWRYVLRGTFEALVNGVSYELNEGDSMYLNSGMPSRWRNAGKSKASALSISTSAVF